ncbi:MAG: hypothetical protein Q4D76_09110 [Oscillospiraceae bacterium]|nr:hypothetical protein [Oscillospiraceae bacterium]
MNTFPLELNKHILFCAIGIIFFLFQFFRQGYKYQIMSAAAIGATLLLYISDTTAWRYTVGVLELVLIIAIFVVMSVEKKNAEKKAAAASENTAETTETAEISETAADGDKTNE